MSDATGAAERKQLSPKVHDVVCQPGRFQIRVDAANQPGVLCGDAGRTVIRVTTLGLDAADRQERLPADRNQIATQSEREEHTLRKSELSRTYKHHAFVHAMFDEQLMHPAESHFEGRGQGVGEAQWAWAGAAFTAINRDEVNEPVAMHHETSELFPKARLAHRRLDPDRQARRLSDHLDEV